MVAGCGATDELGERMGIGVDALLQQSVEEHPASLWPVSIESEGELVQVVLQVFDSGVMAAKRSVTRPVAETDSGSLSGRRGMGQLPRDTDKNIVLDSAGGPDRTVRNLPMRLTEYRR